MHHSQLLRWATILAQCFVIGWSIWFFFAVWTPENLQCADGGDRCLHAGTSPVAERIFHYAAWALTLVLAAVARRKADDGSPKIAISTCLVATLLFATLLFDLGGVFPRPAPLSTE